MHRRHRLRRAADFELLRREGRRWHHPYVVLVAGANRGQISRFGFAAGKRLGQATKRNRVKRIFREVIRNRLGEIEDGWDCLFIARIGAAEASTSELQMAVNELLQRSGLFNEIQSRKQQEKGKLL